VADFQIKYYDHTIICQSKIIYLGIEWVSDCCLTPTRNRYLTSLFIPIYNGLVGCGLVWWCLTPLSTILWRSVILVEENVIPGENHRPATDHWQTLSHNVVHLTLRWIWNHNISGDRHQIYNGQGTIRTEYGRSKLIYRMHKNALLTVLFMMISCVTTQYTINHLYSHKLYIIIMIHRRYTHVHIQ
jgi:hypothetical protein